MSAAHKRKLIDLVEAHPDLWKVTRKAPSLKQKLWNNVGGELGISGYDARRQWEILRDQFRREYKRLTKDRNYKSKWIFYDRMLFMRHALRTHEKHIRLAEFDWDEQGSDDQCPLMYGMDGSKINVEPSNSVGVSSSCPLQCDGNNLTRSKRQWLPKGFEDEDYYFVMSILPSLRSLHGSRKLRVRSRIMELIAAEIDTDEETTQRGTAEAIIQFKAEESQ